MSNYANRKSKMPDVSAKCKQDFSVRDRTIAIVLVAAFLALLMLSIGAFSVQNNQAVKQALLDLAAEKETQDAEYSKKLAELAQREQALTVREDKVTAREDSVTQAEADLENAQAVLASDRANFTAEEEAFYDKQSHVRELSEALYLELAPDE